MDVFVAAAADDQGLAPSGGHAANPVRRCGPSPALEVFEG